ncbi:uncharacterized protein N7484_008248 [Penicillium longicatenatum]|uniref:uncharacterized protein n=1 Tax=Penicillium longicatenatum TaxID=1561947 RepID=UPI00254803D6|nr:uncharacterized protein N7484_008248 [Penicillium longicatenatum]KAJ5634935.1 hypothetical protein N7484_008248 [Penicillium longicatenatum]
MPKSPHYKNPLAPSPLFTSPSKAYIEHLSYPSEKIFYNNKGLIIIDLLREPSKKGLERVGY